MNNRFGDKVALITGAGSGIGRATALAFANEGAKVTVADLQIEKCQEVVSQIKSMGGEATAVKCDVTIAKEVEEMISNTIKVYGSLHFAVNNAGVEGAHAGTIDHTEEIWDRVIDINLKGVWLCMKYELPEMQKQKSGAIVNVSSAAGLIGSAGTAAYTASKHGVVGLTKASALEFAKQHIRINAVCPGFIRTPMLETIINSHPGVEEQLIAREPIGRLADPDEVAQAILGLCSNASSFITGVSLQVDGGLTLL
ncbi:SDR family oxidoreductase [Desulfosporosinus sp. PR]|uniref:SDR family oxidoreductase n=1 Tax=Candidatus Desulfosporosinus nitrosoreducens TaxID=3401928 RepID=UPI0027E7798A|nr:SDR family oxidoreductase [Desulfosporosinus sp. PR]MDQ7092861.1 SDR family oxidoreductase [Desulfosporosinus sp. PR]